MTVMRSGGITTLRSAATSHLVVGEMEVLADEGVAARRGVSHRSRPCWPGPAATGGTGAPITPVITPTGSSTGAKARRPMRSATSDEQGAGQRAGTRVTLYG